MNGASCERGIEAAATTCENVVGVCIRCGRDRNLCGLVRANGLDPGEPCAWHEHAITGRLDSAHWR